MGYYYGYEDDEARGISHDWEAEQEAWEAYGDDEYERRRDDPEYY